MKPNLFLTGCLLALLPLTCKQAQAAERPNILWFVVDDMSANFSCYGETTIQTPHVDRLAKDGLKFTRAYATAPVCSPFRSAMITGMYQTSIGAHHHRSGQGEHRVVLPDGVQPVPALFQKAGFYTCMGSGLLDLDYKTKPITPKYKNRLGKTDYNFDWDKSIYDSHDWAGRAKDQPFFMQVQLHGGKLRGASEASYKAFDKQVLSFFSEVTEPKSVTLPPYYPRDPVLLKDWSTYLDTVRITDHHVGLVMQRLQDEGLLQNTLVVFFTDHGISHARGKQFLYDEGTHIPLIVRGPGIDAQATRTDLVEHIDITALSLAAAGIDIPEKMQGDDILATDYQPKFAVFAARDRCGEAADQVRSVRTNKYLYIKNFFPDRPHLMPSGYKDGKVIVQRLRAMYAKGSLTDLAKELMFAPTRPPEELYLYGTDRWQTENLADDPAHAVALANLREQQNDWGKETGDMGPETPEVYVQETEAQMKSTGNKKAREIYRKNSEIYKRWAVEGK